VLLQDDFSDRRSGWPSRSNDPTTRRVGYEGGEYFVTKMAGSGGAPFVTRPERFADFMAQVDVRLLSPTRDAYIYLDFRRQENRDHYSFVVDPNEPAFLVRRVQAGSGTNLLPWTRSPAINAGSAWNRLGVRAQGTDFVLYINGQEVGRASDPAIREGVLGLGVGSLEDGPAEGRFRDLVVSSPD